MKYKSGRPFILLFGNFMSRLPTALSVADNQVNEFNDVIMANVSSEIG